MSFIADRVVMDGLTFDHVLLIPATFRATASKFSKVVICIRSFLQILYHSITTKVVAINIQASEAVIQDVFLYHSFITPLSLLRHVVFIIQLRTNILSSITFEKAYKIIE